MSKRKSVGKVHPSSAIGTWKNPYGDGCRTYVEAPEGRGEMVEGIHKKRGGET